MAPLYPQQEPLKLTPPADQPATIDGMTPEQEAAWEEQKKAEQEEKDLSTKPYEYREGMEHLKKGPPTLPFDEKPEDYETDTTQPVTPVFVP